MHISFNTAQVFVISVSLKVGCTKNMGLLSRNFLETPITAWPIGGLGDYFLETGASSHPARHLNAKMTNGIYAIINAKKPSTIPVPAK